MRKFIFFGVVIAVLLSTTMVPIDVDDNALLRSMMDGAHYPLFACVAIAVFLGLHALGLPHFLRLVVAGFLSCGLAVAVEMIQPMVSRTASRLDIINGGLGVAAALLCVFVWHRRSHLLLKVVSAIIVVTGLLWTMRPAYHEWRTTRWQKRHHPQIAGFEHSFERHLWYAHGGSGKRTTISLSTERATEGRQSLRVQTPGTSWNSVGISVGERDWSRAKAVAFDVYTAGDLKRIGLAVTDTKGARFKRWNPLQPGWNKIVVPAVDIRQGRGGSSLSMSSIRYFMLYGPPKDPPHLYYVDNVRVIE